MFTSTASSAPAMPSFAQSVNPTPLENFSHELAVNVNAINQINMARMQSDRSDVPPSDSLCTPSYLPVSGTDGLQPYNTPVRNDAVVTAGNALLRAATLPHHSQTDSVPTSTSRTHPAANSTVPDSAELHSAESGTRAGGTHTQV